MGVVPFGAPRRRALPIGRGPYREIVVFLPTEAPDGATALQTARTMSAALGAGRAEIGVDALTGAAEVRLYYDPNLYAAALDYAAHHGLYCEIDRR